MPRTIRIGSWSYDLPEWAPARMAIGVLLILFGFLGFLPVLGFLDGAAGTGGSLVRCSARPLVAAELQDVVARGKERAAAGIAQARW